MTRCGCVSAANLSLKCNNTVKTKDFRYTSKCTLQLGLGCYSGSEFMGTSLKMPYYRVSNERSSRDSYPLQVRSSFTCLMEEFIMEYLE